MNKDVKNKPKQLVSNMIFKILSEFGFKASKIAYMTL